MASIDLSGKTGVVFGVANQRSIAWAISEALINSGTDLAFTYLNDRMRGPVEKTVADLDDPLLVECDATDAEQVKNVYEKAAARLGKVDFVVHCIAFADRDDLGGNFSAVSQDGFRTALVTSAYSLIPVTAEAVPYMPNEGGSVVTLSFDAAGRVYPGYNIMGTAKAALENEVGQLASEFGPKGVRVNAISAGPLATLSARSIPGFNTMRKAFEERSPLGRNITHEEVANTALFLLSDLSSGITGTVIPVDAGYTAMGI